MLKGAFLTCKSTFGKMLLLILEPFYYFIFFCTCLLLVLLIFDKSQDAVQINKSKVNNMHRFIVMLVCVTKKKNLWKLLHFALLLKSLYAILKMS